MERRLIIIPPKMPLALDGSDYRVVSQIHRDVKPDVRSYFAVWDSLNCGLFPELLI